MCAREPLCGKQVYPPGVGEAGSGTGVSVGGSGVRGGAGKVGSGVSLGGTGVGETGVSVIVGAMVVFVTVGGMMIWVAVQVGGTTWVLGVTFGTLMICPANILVEDPMQLAICKAAAVVL